MKNGPTDVSGHTNTYGNIIPFAYRAYMEHASDQWRSRNNF